jgi:NAD(P)-dependent dehydrogenase (short-subunit alcohol dehydrogenase family)
MILDKFDLSGKTAIITGGGTGLGRAMALSLADAGADGGVAARRVEPLDC